MVEADNIYSEMDALVADLRSDGLTDWADRIAGSILAGATGTEILMGARWNIQQLLSVEGASLPSAIRLRATAITAAITGALG